ncbi:MAG: hypothetical protein P1V35_01885 [Planctomycetota bacterium]|nr:hypothetical protein [Planctomycetota bacterium]
MSAPWRLITTFGAPPDFNMGLDEALLELGERPTLRLYTWSPDTLSLGYFQKLTDVPDREKASHLVRRITGGGAIHHTKELTFSLTTNASDPLYRGNVADSYVRIHRAVMHALEQVGIKAELACRAIGPGASAGLTGLQLAAESNDSIAPDAGQESTSPMDPAKAKDSSAAAEAPGAADSTTCPGGTSTTPVDSDLEGTGMCFHKSTPQDILWANKKGVGSAQRRRGGRVLHHGSIKLGTSPLEGNIATLSESGSNITPQDFARILVEAFTATLGIRFQRGAPNPVELEHATVLGPRYSSEEFLNRR